jgi:hypothetical protein
MTKRKPDEDKAKRQARQAADGKVAMKEYQEKAEHLARNTARLRAERLAREAREVAELPSESDRPTEH